MCFERKQKSFHLPWLGSQNWGRTAVITYNTLLDELIEEGLAREAWIFGRQLTMDNTIELNMVVYSTILKALCRDKCFDLAHSLLRVMENKGFWPNVKTYGNFIHSLCEDGHVDEAQSLLKEIKTKNIKPDLPIFNSILKCLVAYYRDITKGRLLIRRVMPEHGVYPSCETHSILIKGLCINGYVDEADEVLKSMINEGIKPDSIAFNQFIRAYASNHNLKKARAWFDEMHHVGVKPDIYSYNSLMHAYGKHTYMLDQALDLFHDMSDQGIRHDIVSCNTLLRAMLFEGHRRYNKQPLQLFNKMTHHDLATYHIYIQGMCFQRKLDQALGLFNLICHILPPLDNYNVMMYAAMKAHNLHVMEMVWKLMEHQGLEPDVTSHNILIQGFACHGRLDDAMKMFKRGKSDFEGYNAIVTELMKSNRTKEAIDFIKEHEEAAYQVHLATVELAADLFLDKDPEVFQAIAAALKLEERLILSDVLRGRSGAPR